MIDILPIAGMVFSLLLALIVGGVILVFPLTKRLGQLIEIRMEERRQGLAEGAPPPSSGELAGVKDAIDGLQAEVAGLLERQQFLERLLESGERPPSRGGGARDAPG